MVDTITHSGTASADDLSGSGGNDVMLGFAGDDTISGRAGDDALYGDYQNDNHLDGTSGAYGFADYGNSGHWTVTSLDGGHQTMSQTIATETSGVYSVSFEIAANFAAGVTSVGVEILVGDTVIKTVSSDSGAFGAHDVSFTATGTETTLTVRSIAVEGSGPAIDTSGPVFHYDKEVVIDGAPVTVAAFAEGQSNLLQVLNGTLYVFDTATSTYEKAGVNGTVNVNSMGFNQQDDLLYAIAVGNGTDALGNAVTHSDLVMIDADGKSYRIGDTPYRSWTGDFDDQGNLWSFNSSMNHIAVIDVDNLDGDGNPVTTVHKLPHDLVQKNFYDLAYDAENQVFRGICRPSAEGQPTTLLTVDISSGTPEFSEMAVTHTVIDGETHTGVPAITFGAAIYDTDGNLFVGGNSGDHDMNNSTRTAGGIYKVIINPDTGTATLELITSAPKSYSNDGAADPRALNPFVDVDLSSSVLIRNLEMTATAEGELSYDDTLEGEGGEDLLVGGLGEDFIVGGSRGDVLDGGTGNDSLYGGGAPGSGPAGRSYYDATGARFDADGNPLAPDDDDLSGGAGNDHLSGSAGHDTLDGGIGNDTLSGGSGFDTLRGGDGDDDLSGGANTDALWGEDGADTLVGGSGDDTLHGGADADQMNGGSHDDLLYGGTGDDNMNGSSGDDVLNGDEGADTLIGGTGDDVLNGGDGDDSLTAGSGDDVVSGEDGADRVIGGTGNDNLSGGAGRDRLKGDAGNDTLDGGADRDHLSGGYGNDVLNGGAGRDQLYLGAGDDVATGGADSDRFVFRSDDLTGGTDEITDFSISDRDRFDLRQLNLADSEAEELAWFNDNVTILSSGDAVVTLGSSTVTLTGVLENDSASTTPLFDCFLF